MNTRPYSDLYGLVEALCGCTFAAQEAVRVKYFINRRAQRAYAESEYWPRFYVVGEERNVSDAGLLPDEQDGLNDIGTVLRIHASAPFLTTVAAEYGDFYKGASGTQITGYSANKESSDLVLSGTITPDITGLFLNMGFTTGPDIGSKVSYSINGYDPTGLPSVEGDDSQIYWDDASSEWVIANYVSLSLYAAWTSTDDVETPDLVSTWTPFNSASVVATGTPVLSPNSATAFVTYKAALSATYGTADGDTADVPEEWFEYMAHGAYSDFLRNDQQQDRAALAEQEANEILMSQLEKIGRQNGSSVFTRVVTQANTQWR